jgi:hypothetical protein
LPFFFLNEFKHGCILGQTQYLGPSAQGSVYSNLMVFNLLRRSDESDVSDGRICDVLNRVGSFGCEPVDDLAGFGLSFTDIAP